MNQFQITLLIGACGTLVLTRYSPRAWLWVLLGAVSFIASTAYCRYGLPYPSAFSIACDAAIVLAIYHLAESDEELVLWRVFQAMVLVNILQLAGLITSQWLYVVSLEVLNWIALLTINYTAITERKSKGESSVSHYRSDHIRGTGVALQRQRTNDPWHKVKN